MAGERQNGLSEEGSGHRVSIVDIASVVGVHFTTVARALKDSPRVSPATRERVKAVAAEMGYQADPLISALCSYRGGLRAPAFRGTLSWINGFEEADYFETAFGFYAGCYAGARKRCEELGFKLEQLWLGEPGMTARRASQVISSRGISGVLVGPMPHNVEELKIDWDRFCSVRIGYSLSVTGVANVICDHFSNTKVLHAALVERGFRRIGFACDRWIDDRVSRKWSGGYLAMEYKRRRRLELEPFFGTHSPDNQENFDRWLQATSPDAVITGGGPRYVELLRSSKAPEAKALQLYSLSVDSDWSGTLKGIRQEGALVGSAAVDQLSSMVQLHRVGMDSIPKTILVGGSLNL